MDTQRKKVASATEGADQQVVVAGKAGKTVDMLLPILRKHSVQFHRIPVGEAVIDAIVEMPLVDLVLIAYPRSWRPSKPGCPRCGHRSWW
jgi:hypothetical protein